jgi:2'-5' RNA ligase
MSSTPDSTLVILVPSAEATVAKLRRRLDRLAAWAVPAHITVLYPFAAPDSISDEVVVRLARILERVRAFDFALTTIGWFDERVLYLSPTPVAPFIEITNAIAAEFPEYTPYGGAYDKVVPHLTVGEGASRWRMRRAARRLEPHLPIEATATEVNLMAPNPSGRWVIQQQFGLGR